MTVEAGFDDGNGGLGDGERLARAADQARDSRRMRAKRAARTAALGVDVPYVKVGDIDVSVEWTIKNLDSMPGNAQIELNGANECFVYDPSLIMLGPRRRGAADAWPRRRHPDRHPGERRGRPGCSARTSCSRPRSISTRSRAATSTRSRATLTINKNDRLVVPLLPTPDDADDAVMQPDPIGRADPARGVPRDHPGRSRLQADPHMILDYNVRVRDIRDIMNDKLLSAPMGELTQFNPMPFTLMAAPGAVIFGAPG